MYLTPWWCSLGDLFDASSSICLSFFYLDGQTKYFSRDGWDKGVDLARVNSVVQLHGSEVVFIKFLLESGIVLKV